MSVLGRLTFFFMYRDDLICEKIHSDKFIDFRNFGIAGKAMIVEGYSGTQFLMLTDRVNGKWKIMIYFVWHSVYFKAILKKFSFNEQMKKHEMQEISNSQTVMRVKSELPLSLSPILYSPQRF